MIYDLTDQQWIKLTLDTPLTHVSNNDPILTRIRGIILELHTIAPVEKITLAAPGPPPPFNFEVKLLDGRKWKQTISERTVDPLMTYDVPGSWRLSETTAVIKVIAAIAVAINNLKLLALDAKPR